MRETLVECVRLGGNILRDRFQRVRQTTRKENISSVVTEADLAAEEAILRVVAGRHPDHGLIAEETGYRPGPSEFTWVIDPLDGTSNFAAGLPWYGVMVAVLRGPRPVLGAMYLPDSDTLYLAEEGGGVWRNCVRVSVTAETDLANVLCAYGLDASPDPEQTAREVRMLGLLANRVRNLRGTNSLLDFCYTLDGRLGACVNHSTRIWDIAPVCLMMAEAGGRLTDLKGRDILFHPEPRPQDRSYSVAAASRALLPQILEIARQAGW